MAEKPSRNLGEYLPTFASIIVGVIPVVLLITIWDVSRKLIVGWGGLSYIIGVIAFKLPLYRFVVERYLHPRLSHALLAVSQGFVSAVSELGSAALFFLFVLPDLTLPQLVGFGAAAGAVEAVILPFIKNPLKGTAVGDHSTDITTKAEGNLAVEWMAVLERILAMGIHVGSRSLLYLSISTLSFFPAFAAVVTFASIDGTAYYGYLKRWEFDKVRMLLRLYGFILAIVILQLGLFQLLAE